ncbi:hypothetical protein C8J57DRAFT_1471602 [Mycena rebaudengoi]|nr:hypothetical protein C8J57DRAFT_1471602 [Mycena rebaudengoi]
MRTLLRIYASPRTWLRSRNGLDTSPRRGKIYFRSQSPASSPTRARRILPESPGRLCDAQCLCTEFCGSCENAASAFFFSSSWLVAHGS